MRQGRRSFARDLTAKHMEGVGDPERRELVRGARGLDRPVEFGPTVVRTPHEAQSNAAEGQEAEAGAEPQSIGPKVEIFVTKLKTLLRDRKAFADPPGIELGSTEAVSNRHSQGRVLGTVRSLNGFEKRIERLIDSSGSCPELAVAVQHLAENMRIVAARRELPCFAKERDRLVF